jgi:hypothetical protein
MTPGISFRVQLTQFDQLAESVRSGEGRLTVVTNLNDCDEPLFETWIGTEARVPILISDPGEKMHHA